MILFFDTETDGFVDDRMPPGHDCQPQLVQLACLLTDDDGTERAMYNSIVQPIRRQIPDGAAKVHGIDTETAQRVGVYPSVAVFIWDRLAQMADTIVAHNMKFDSAVMETQWLRYRPARIQAPENEMAVRLSGKSWLCTMDMATPILNMPPTSRMLEVGFNKPKPPKLEECIQFWFSEKHDKAHDALADVRACARIYFHMKSLEQVAA